MLLVPRRQAKRPAHARCLLLLVCGVAQAFLLSPPRQPLSLPLQILKPLAWRPGDASGTPQPKSYNAIPRRSSTTLSSSSAAASGDLEAFRRVVQGRYSNSDYLPDPVPQDVIRDLLEMTIRAPTSFNSQPYTAIMVKSLAMREQLSGAMLSANAKRVLDAPVAVVFAADMECSRTVGKLQDLMRRTGYWNEDFLQKLPLFLSVFSTGHRFALLRSIMFWVKRVSAFIVGLFSPMPRVERASTWATKNTMLAVQTFMLAATAHGLTTCAMEGFDEARVKWILGIPSSRYHVPVVLSLGYPNPDGPPKKPSLRYSVDELFHTDKYQQPL